MDKTYNVLIEGQSIPVPAEIGEDDAKVKAALAPFYPDAANAMITRTEKDNTDGSQVVTINVVKRAGTKGQAAAPQPLSPLEALQACKGRRNPAIELYEEIQAQEGYSIEELLALDERIPKAIEDGLAQHDAIERAKKRLIGTRAQAAKAVVEGF